MPLKTKYKSGTRIINKKPISPKQKNIPKVSVSTQVQFIMV